VTFEGVTGLFDSFMVSYTIIFLFSFGDNVCHICNVISIIKCVLRIDWTITKLFIMFHLACKILFPLSLHVVYWHGTMFVKFITPSTLANHIIILVLCAKNSLNYWLLLVWNWCTHKCTTNVDGGSQVLTLFSSLIFIVLMMYCIDAIMECLQLQFIWTLVSWYLDLELVDN
jgi:hypothetical protein